jgi:dimethylhistidine N-methyltransferase
MSKIHNSFREDVIKGLTSFPKSLPSKYIYDKNGDKLFQNIMAMPEYYLTNCEFEILDRHKVAICKAFAKDGDFDLIELGAGDGKKTKILLKELIEQNSDFSYLPIDISKSVLEVLADSISVEIPKVKIETKQGTYFEVLSELDQYRHRKKVILFLGSNIGNLLHENAIKFLKAIRKNMHDNDMLFIGFDQKKNPQTILDAYDDQSGITERFNKNLLLRINKTFIADFNPDHFLHWETYNPETGTAMSYLVSKIEQKVEIKGLSLHVDFKAWETIHIEISQKYDEEIIEWLAKESGLKVYSSYTDTQSYFKNYVFVKNA